MEESMLQLLSIGCMYLNCILYMAYRIISHFRKYASRYYVVTQRDQIINKLRTGSGCKLEPELRIPVAGGSLHVNLSYDKKIQATDWQSTDRNLLAGLSWCDQNNQSLRVT